MSSSTKTTDVSAGYRSNSHAHKQNSANGSRSGHSTLSIQLTTSKQPNDCLYCQKVSLDKSLNNDCPNENFFHQMMNKTLYDKYSSSQNYYYTKDLNEVIANNRCSASIRLKDFNSYDEVDEYLKRYYKISEYEIKNKMLSEYYKFHKDIPRLFMIPTTNILNKFHDRKRRIEYVKITRLLKKDDSNNQKDKLGNEYLKDRIDCEAEFNQAAWCRVSKNSNNQDNAVSSHYLIDQNGPVKNHGNIHKTKKEVSCSDTIHDLNQKLGEIIWSNSRMMDLNFHENESFTNPSINNFLMFLKNNDSNFSVNNTIQQSSQLYIPVINNNPSRNHNAEENRVSRPNIMLPSSYNYKKSNNILQDLQSIDEKKFHPQRTPGASHQIPHIKLSSANDSPINSPALPKSKNELIINPNLMQKKKSSGAIDAYLLSKAENPEHTRKSSGTGVFTRKISLDENFMGQHIRLSSETQCDRVYKPGPIKAFVKNAQINNECAPHITTHSSDKDTGDSPQINYKVQSASQKPTPTQGMAKKNSLANDPAQAMFITSEIAEKLQIRQRGNDSEKKIVPKEQQKLGLNLKNSGVTFGNMPQNNNNHLKSSNVYKKKLSNPAISSKDINILSNQNQNSLNLKANLVSSLVNFGVKAMINNAAKANQISKCGSSKNMVSFPEKSPTIKKITENNNPKLKIGTTPINNQSSNNNIGKSLTKFTMNTRHGSLATNSNGFQNKEKDILIIGQQKGAKSQIKENPSIISSYSKSFKSSQSSQINTNQLTYPSNPTIALSESSEQQNKNKASIVSATSSVGQKTSVSKVNNFLNERSNSTTYDIAGTINSSRNCQNQKTSQDETPSCKDFLGVARKSANNIYTSAQIQKLIKKKDPPHQKQSVERKPHNDNDLQIIQETEKLKKALIAKNIVKKPTHTNAGGIESKVLGMLQNTDQVSLGKKKIHEGGLLQKNGQKMSESSQEKMNSARSSKTSPLKFVTSYEGMKKI